MSWSDESILGQIAQSSSTLPDRYQPRGAASASRTAHSELDPKRRRLTADLINRLPRCPCCAAPIARHSTGKLRDSVRPLNFRETNLASTIVSANFIGRVHRQRLSRMSRPSVATTSNRATLYPLRRRLELPCQYSAASTMAFVVGDSAPRTVHDKIASLASGARSVFRSLARSCVCSWSRCVPAWPFPFLALFRTFGQSGKAGQCFSHPRAAADAGDHHVNHCEGRMEVAAGF